MINWIEYTGHKVELTGSRKPVDNTIYTFDIETTSYIVFHGKQYEPKFYETLTKKEQEECYFMSTMYIWQFSVNDTVYYGRTWEELEQFLKRLEYFGTYQKKIVFVHNLSYEFQFLRNKFRFSSVFARKSRKLIKCEMLDFNIEFRCSYMMTNVALERLPSIYGLNVQKLVGNLDYNVPRNNKTVLTEKELAYCENDCLVVYEYIKSERERYGKISKIPLTATGHVRKEFRDSIYKNYKYLNKVHKSINTDGHVFNLMQEAFARWLYTL